MQSPTDHAHEAIGHTVCSPNSTPQEMENEADERAAMREKERQDKEEEEEITKSWKRRGDKKTRNT